MEKAVHRFIIDFFVGEDEMRPNTTADFTLECAWIQASLLYIDGTAYGELINVGYDVFKCHYVLEFARVTKDSDELIELIEKLKQLELAGGLTKVKREGIIEKLRR